jgi:hypothetical protein
MQRDPASLSGKRRERNGFDLEWNGSELSGRRAAVAAL